MIRPCDLDRVNLYLLGVSQEEAEVYPSLSKEWIIDVIISLKMVQLNYNYFITVIKCDSYHVRDVLQQT